NRLITSKYHLSLNQVKFISFMSSKIKRDDEDFFTYSFKVNDILNVLGIERTHYKQLRIALRKLMTKYVVLEDNEFSIKETTFLSYFHVNKKQDLIEMRFDKSLKPFLLQLNQKFTKLSLAKILRFNSQYTIRMYEILESKMNLYDKYKNRNLLEFEYSLKELKEILSGEYNEDTEQIEIPKSYNSYNNFKRKVLDISFNELKNKGDYYFEYELIKTGRTYTSIKFKIFKNGEKIKKDFVEKKKTMLLSGKEKNLAMEQIRRIIERKGDTIKDKLKYEQKLFQLYLRGELKYDKDLEDIRKEMEAKELSELLKKN
ncbi:MAG: replication initiation protein, partial [Sulfurovaceae bacterium]|nr:replication initiation protein [Sulfurovaceae bacterium]